MLFEKFVGLIKDRLHSYLDGIRRHELNGRLDTGGVNVIYPNMLLVVNCGGYYVAELMGSTVVYNGLVVKRHLEKTIYRYLNPFHQKEGVPSSALFGGGPEVAVIKGLCLSNFKDLDKLEHRFPAVRMYETKFVCDGAEAMFAFSSEFGSLLLENTLIAAQSGAAQRIKHVVSSFIFRSNVDRNDLAAAMDHYLSGSDVRIVQGYADLVTKDLMVATQLQSLYMINKIRETTIGEFVRQHPHIIKRAFSTDDFIYEPSFKWLEHSGNCEDHSINPDLMIRRDDGCYDIYDLKTALLDKRQLTKNDRKRRALIDCVYDGANQLGNYREYFSYKKNAEHALEKYKVVVRNPKLTLVVGSWENYSAVEVAEACRMMPDLTVIDYDTMIHNFLRASTMAGPH